VVHFNRIFQLIGFALGIPPIGEDIGGNFLVNEKIIENIRKQELEEQEDLDQDELEEIEDELAGIEE